MFIGILLLIIGVLMLLDRTGLINIHVGEFILPAILVALGVSMISKGSKSKK